MHYYKRHIGDYAKKAGHLSPLEHGVYNLIIDSYYDREQAPTLVDAMRWARARTEDEKAAVQVVLEEFFTFDGERYRQNRIEDELEQYHSKSEINRGIAVEREKKKRERIEAAALAKRERESQERTPEQHDSCTTGSPEEDDSSTPGQPNHKPLTTNHKPETKEKKRSAPPTGDADLFPGVDPQVVADFKALRKQKKAAITQTAMGDIVKEAGKANMTLDAALRVCCSRGWAGFKAEWVMRGDERRGGVANTGNRPESRHSGFENIDYSEGIENGRIT